MPMACFESNTAVTVPSTGTLTSPSYFNETWVTIYKLSLSRQYM